MEKLKALTVRDWLLIAVIILAISTLVVTSIWAKKLNNRLDSMESTIEDNIGAQNIIYSDDNDEPEAPSILSNYDLSYGKATTLSDSNYKIDFKISATPLEFKTSTIAKAKIDGKSYDLDRKDNEFSTTIRRSIFEGISSTEIILKDGDTIRTEDVSFDMANEPYVGAKRQWDIVSETASSRTKEAVTLDQEFTYSEIDAIEEDEEVGQAPKNLAFLGVVDGKTVFKQKGKMVKRGDDWEYGYARLKVTAKLPADKTMDIYILEQGPYGLTWKYPIERVYPYKTGEAELIKQINYKNQAVIALDAKGKEVWSGKVYSE